MWQLIVKGVISGIIVVAASEVARRSPIWAAILVSLPLTSILALTWLWAETKDVSQVVDLSWGILWVIVPSLVFFIILPLLLNRGVPFVGAMLASVAVMVPVYAGYVAMLRRAGVDV